MTHTPLLTARRAAFLVAAVAGAVYLNSLGNGFALDDVWIIQQNGRVHDLARIREILLRPYWPYFGAELGLYRPLAILSYALQWAAGGGAAWVFHLVSMLLHAGASVLVLLLLRRFAAPLPALFGALVFAVHPVHTEAVANIVGQAELIAAAALLGICLLHIDRPALGVSWRRTAAYVALFAVAMGTKENAVVIPLLLVLVDVAGRRVELTRRGLLRYADALAFPMLLLAGVLAAYLLLRYQALDGRLMGVDANPGLPFLREELRVLNAFRAFPEFLRLLFFPLRLSADYSPGVILPVTALSPLTVLGAVLVAVVTGLTLLTPWLPRLGLPAGWFLITILTVSNFFFPIGVLVAERTLYLPSVAAALAFSFVAGAVLPLATGRDRRTLAIAAIVVIAAGAVRTWIRNPEWKSTMSVYTAVTRDHPESYRGQWALASLNWELGNIPAAAHHFQLAYMIYPRDSQFLAEYANFFIGLGEYERAVELLERSLAMLPDVPATVTLLAYAYVMNGQHQQALATIADAERLGAARFTAMPLRALAYEGLGRRNEAIGAWRVALDHMRSPDWRFWAYFSRTLASAGARAEADTALSRARTSAGTDSAALRTLGELESHHRLGCYAPGAAPDRCADPLGGLVGFSKPLAKSTSVLQNATIVSPQGGVTTPGRSAQDQP